MNNEENAVIKADKQLDETLSAAPSLGKNENNLLDSLIEMSDDLWDKINLPQSLWEEAFLLS